MKIHSADRRERLPIADAIRGTVHAVQFYETDDYLLQTLTEYVAGTYFTLDARELLARFTIDGSISPTRFADIVGGLIAQARGEGGARQVRVFGEMVALLWAEGDRNLTRRLSFPLLCAYPASSSPRTVTRLSMSRISARSTSRGDRRRTNRTKVEPKGPPVSACYF